MTNVGFVFVVLDYRALRFSITEYREGPRWQALVVSLTTRRTVLVSFEYGALRLRITEVFAVVSVFRIPYSVICNL